MGVWLCVPFNRFDFAADLRRNNKDHDTRTTSTTATRRTNNVAGVARSRLNPNRGFDFGYVA